MRRRSWALATALAAVAPLDCGGDDGGGTGDLVWVRQPVVVKQETLPRDRVLVGKVRNDSLRRVVLDAKDVRALDEDGKALRANATFILGISIRSTHPRDRRRAACPSPSSSASGGACA